MICVEPPEGSAVRSIPPFSAEDGESLWWQAYARGKTKITLDLQKGSDLDHLHQLVAGADFLVESLSSQSVKELKLDQDSLQEVNPKIISVSVTPFGRNGPKADWPATDLTVWAASGAQALAGDSDRAPVRTSVPQTYMHAGADAVGGALIALQECHKSGRGQNVDVSAQQSAAQAALSANLATHNNSEVVVGRAAGGCRELSKPSSPGLAWTDTLRLPFCLGLPSPNLTEDYCRG